MWGLGQLVQNLHYDSECAFIPQVSVSGLSEVISWSCRERERAASLLHSYHLLFDPDHQPLQVTVAQKIRAIKLPKNVYSMFKNHKHYIRANDKITRTFLSTDSGSTDAFNSGLKVNSGCPLSKHKHVWRHAKCYKTLSRVFQLMNMKFEHMF